MRLSIMAKMALSLVCMSFLAVTMAMGIGKCVLNAQNQREALKEEYVRTALGSYKGQAHAWTEYYDLETGKSLLAKDTVGPSIRGKMLYPHKGFPVEAYKSGKRYDYKVTSYAYPDSAPDFENEAMLYKKKILAWVPREYR